MERLNSVTTLQTISSKSIPESGGHTIDITGNVFFLGCLIIAVVAILTTMFCILLVCTSNQRLRIFHVVPIGAYYNKNEEEDTLFESVLFACYDKTSDNWEAIAKIPLLNKRQFQFLKLVKPFVIKEKPYNYNVSEILLDECNVWFDAKILCPVSTESICCNKKYRGAVESVNAFNSDARDSDEELGNSSFHRRIDESDDDISIMSESSTNLNGIGLRSASIVGESFTSQNTKYEAMSSKELFQIYRNSLRS